MKDPKSKAATLLLIEDDEVDAARLEWALRKAKIGNPVVVVRSAEAALATLREDSYSQSGPAPPYLILLDLVLPGMSGLDFLRELRSDPVRGDTTVLVLTGSEEKRHEMQARALGVYAYIRKSNCSEDFLQVVKRLRASWSLVVELQEA